MKDSSPLVQVIEQQIPADPSPLLLLGPLAFTTKIGQTLSRPVILIDDQGQVDPLVRPSAQRSIIRASLPQLPLAEKSIGALVGVEVLSRYPSPFSLLVLWSAVLRWGGTLILVEPLIQSKTMRTLKRLFAPSRTFLPPEQLTCLLLNAGFTGVRQCWPAARHRALLTTGSLLTA